MKNASPETQAPRQGMIIATKRIVEDEQKVCFMYREEPMDAKDSGWRMFAGNESQEYVDDPKNSDVYSPAAILMVDDSIAALLDEPVGSAFEREDGTSEWEIASGYSLGGQDELQTEQLGGGWKIEISGIFERYEEDEGDTVFAAEGRTARLAIWDFSEKSHEEVATMHREFIDNRDQSEAPTLEDINFEEEGILRMGFVVEESDDSHSYHVLYGYTIMGNEVAQGAYYFDDPEEKNWAVTTWQSVTMV